MSEKNVASPQSMEEFLSRYHSNERIEGFGITGVTIHMPCPFCAAPDFIVYKLIDTHEALQRGGTCAECGRSMQVNVTDTPTAKHMSFVQTGGPDQPEWLEPKIPRA